MKQMRIITAVERTAVENLQGMVRVSNTEVTLPPMVGWEAITIKPHARLTCEEKTEDRNTVWTATLTFKTFGELECGGRWAYRCRLSSGEYRLVGTDGRPYPVAKHTESHPENVTDNQLTEVTVTWQTPSSIPFIR